MNKLWKCFVHVVSSNEQDIKKNGWFIITLSKSWPNCIQIISKDHFLIHFLILIHIRTIKKEQSAIRYPDQNVSFKVESEFIDLV